jgi:hypothetical protein
VLAGWSGGGEQNGARSEQHHYEREREASLVLSDRPVP